VGNYDDLAQLLFTIAAFYDVVCFCGGGGAYFSNSVDFLLNLGHFSNSLISS
jgi:hypothetical protein